jgi:hypothetical protein
MRIVYDVSMAWLDCGEAANSEIYSEICSGISSFGSGIAGKIRLRAVSARLPWSKEHRE